MGALTFLGVLVVPLTSDSGLCYDYEAGKKANSSEAWQKPFVPRFCLANCEDKKVMMIIIVTITIGAHSGIKKARQKNDGRNYSFVFRFF